MPGYLSALIGLVLIGIAGVLLVSLATDSTGWMRHLPFIVRMPWERTDESSGSSLDWLALVLGAAFGIVGFFFLAGAILGAIV